MFELSIHPLSGNARRIRLGFLGMSCSPVVGAYFYNQGYRLPFWVCPVRHWTGIPCPSCGMTRSFVAIARGDWSQALAQHLFGPLLFIVLLMTTIHLTLELLTGRRVLTFYDKVLRRKKLQWLFLIMLLIYHALRLYYLSKTGELSLAVEKSPLGQWLASSAGAP